MGRASLGDPSSSASLRASDRGIAGPLVRAIVGNVAFRGDGARSMAGDPRGSRWGVVRSVIARNPIAVAFCRFLVEAAAESGVSADGHLSGDNLK